MVNVSTVSQFSSMHVLTLRRCYKCIPSVLAWARQVQHQHTLAGQQHPSGILSEYQRLVSAGKLHEDAAQLAAVQALQLLQEGLILHLHNVPSRQRPLQPAAAAAAPQLDHAPANSSSSASAGATATAGPSTQAGRASPAVQGAYLWGPVGSGKTMIMDLFLKTLPATVSVTLPAADMPNTPKDIGSTSGSSGGSCSSSNGRSSTSPVPGVKDVVQVQVSTQQLHFHTFMLGVHQQLHRLHEALPKVVGRSRAGLPVYRHALPPEDPILLVARAAAADTHLLCLDELHVTDVADAMLLSRLFGELLRCGCMVVFTSNRPARDLYKGGLSRRYFEPFIRLVDDRLIQLRIAGGKDYRQAAAAAQHHQQGQDAPPAHLGTWYTGPGSDQLLHGEWQKLVQQINGLSNSALHTGAGAGASAGPHLEAPLAAVEDHSAQHLLPCPTHIQLPFGRSLYVPKAVRIPRMAMQHPQQYGSRYWQSLDGPQQQPQQRDAEAGAQEQQEQQQLAGALFTFEELCGNQGSRQSLAHAGALSANDYLALVHSCRVIFVQGVPQLHPKHRDEARRLVTLIDLVYEAHTLQPGSVRLCVSSEAPPHELFLPLLGAAARQGVNPNLGRAAGKLDVQQLIKVATNIAPTNTGRGSAVAGEDATVGTQRPIASAAGIRSRAAAAAAYEGEQQPPALLAEEVLMYHRSSSRLVELCAVVPSGAGAC